MADVFSQIQEYTYPLRALFYLLTPTEASPRNLQDAIVPLPKTLPFIFTLIMLEILYSLAKKRKVYQINDSITCLSARIFSFIPHIGATSLQLSLYYWLHQNYRIVTLPLDSVSTWLITILAIDFFFYWWHRAAHEVNILWAFHQTHHSSECINFISALRFPVYVELSAMFFKLPMALFLPLEMFLMHDGLNSLYQIWIHSEVIRPLGPIEWVFNTPTHHRVHHGRNPYCIDKNYAGFLIIWDRMFGTFQEVKEDETIYYGLVHNIKTFDFLYVEFGSFAEIWRKLRRILKADNYSRIEKAKKVVGALIYGPGWNFKKPEFRLGDPRDLPKIDLSHERFDPQISWWQTAYCIVHFAVLGISTILLGNIPPDNFQKYAIVAYYVTTACSIGYILDDKWFAPHFECLRCIILPAFYLPVSIEKYISKELFLSFHVISLIPWGFALAFSKRGNKTEPLL